MSDRIPFRIVRATVAGKEVGAFVPADDIARQKLRRAGFKANEVVYAELKQPRNPRFFNLMHKFGDLLAENVDKFAGKSAHDVLKRLQIEADIACDHAVIEIDGIPMEYRIAQSLSFADMDEGRAHEVWEQMVEHVAAKYWPDLDAEKVEQMAELVA